MSNTAIPIIGAAAAETEAKILALPVAEREELALDDTTPADTLAILGRDLCWWVRKMVAANQSTPAETLAELAEVSNSEIREKVAANPSTPANVLATFDLEQETPQLCYNVASNKNTPADTLMVLAKHPEQDVRQGLAWNPSTPADALAVLAKDGEWQIRAAVARHPNIPDQTPNHPKIIQTIFSRQLAGANNNTYCISK